MIDRRKCIGNGNDYLEPEEYNTLSRYKKKQYTYCSICKTYFNHITGDKCGCGLTERK